MRKQFLVLAVALASASVYIIAIMIQESSDLAGHWTFDSASGGHAQDLSIYGNHAKLETGDEPASRKIVKGRIGNALYLDGKDDYIEIPDSGRYSASAKGALTISFWMKPATFEFYTPEEGGWIDFLAKEDMQFEWAFRIYNSTAKDPDFRPKRISFYIFNQDGGLGTGTYFQDDLKEDEWIFVAGVINGTHVLIYKNGALRNAAYYAGEGAFVIVNPKHGNSPISIGSPWQDSFYKMGMDDLRIYKRALTSDEIMMLYRNNTIR